MAFSFLGTIANWIDDDWELLERVVDFRHLGEDEHTGVGGVRAFLEGLKSMGIATKICSFFLCFTSTRSVLIFFEHIDGITLDNVASNDVLCRTLTGLLMQRYGITFNPDNAQIHCLAHVVNLVVQKIMKVAGEVDDGPDLRDYYDLFLKNLPFHFKLDDDEDLQAWEGESYDDAESWEPPADAEAEETTEIPTTPLGKVRAYYYV